MEAEKKNRNVPKILVVEDHRMYYAWLKLMCLVPEFSWVDNGEKAVCGIMKKHYYDAIIMNVQMPVMNGLEATLEIRKLYYERPIIGWSAYTKEEAEEACIYAGMDIFVERLGPDLGVGQIVDYLKTKHIL